MHMASWFSRPEVVELLIEASQDINMVNDAQETPLLLFVRSMGSTIRSYSSACIPSVDESAGHARSLENEETHPRLQSPRMLVKAGADLNTQSLAGRTPLHELMLCKPSISKAKIASTELFISYMRQLADV